MKGSLVKILFPLAVVVQQEMWFFHKSDTDGRAPIRVAKWVCEVKQTSKNCVKYKKA